MPLQIVKNDITKMKTDAIVNAANSSLLGGGGVDGAIHRAAGPRLLEECRELHGCQTGEAKITLGYDLPAGHVIHTVGPIYRDGRHGEEEQLRACYRNSLCCAVENGCKTVAFPLISAGAYGYPKEEALQVAVSEISRFLTDAAADVSVYLVVYGKDDFRIPRAVSENVKAYLDEYYTEEPAVALYEEGDFLAAPTAIHEAPKYLRMEMPEDLQKELEHLDDGFSQMLLRLIDERHMSDAECYKKANIDRRLFSKIRSNPSYRPTKQTVLAFAVALELDLDTAKELLSAAGFALSHSSKFDVIVEYFIHSGNYDIFEINEVLFAFDQCLLGG